MDGGLQSLRTALEDALDDLSSPRTAGHVKTQALRSLEKILAAACVPKSATDVLDHFLPLQYTFECNVSSRILSWIASATITLEQHTNKGTIEPETTEVGTLSSQLALALSILQGVCLIHLPTKTYLGKRSALEVLLDLFLVSRHLSESSSPFASASDSPVKSTPSQGQCAPPPLASLILDTLLCVLVDASPALRVFEAAHGVHAVVKILKRAGTPREVRMKCLEFLYFYLLDETTPSTPLPITTPTTPAPTAPSTPMHAPTGKKKLAFPNGGTPARPLSRYGSSTYSLTSSSFDSTSSSESRSTSGSSASSFSSTSSVAGTTPSIAGTASSSRAGSTSPKKQRRTQTPRLLMLRRELEFVPLSPGPKKAGVAGADGTPLKRARGVGGGGGVARTRSMLVVQSDEERGVTQSDEDDNEGCGREGDELEGIRKNEKHRDGHGGADARTTEEKKLLLGTMLGNVEALVEGVRKAGIWGLG